MRHSLTPFFTPLEQVRGRVYISGKMSGTGPEQERRFDGVAESLRSAGYSVCNPYDTSEFLGNLKHTEYLRFDFARILEADFVLALTGWESSPGARAELHMALTMGLPVWEGEDLESTLLTQLYLHDIEAVI